jgi:redox-sensitive bicupin YhaK (pirin superfamily)
MSVLEDREPECAHCASPSIGLVIRAKVRDLGGFSVRRTLPSMAKRIVGPFTFFDHMGPATFERGQGFDVRPHPHIGLATITYLFDGAVLHKDSIGSAQTIRPGDVNWMTAGRGIAHSERTPPAERETGSPLHGIQTWVALPLDVEECEPSFQHHAGEGLPLIRKPGVDLRVLAGTAYGHASPARGLSPTLYVHAVIEEGASLAIDETHPERAAYVVEGAIRCDDETYEEGTMLVFKNGANATVTAMRRAVLMIVGGAPLEGPRYMEWNFVSSDRARIDRAKDDWRAERFPKVVGDEVERIPLPGT